MAHAQQAPLAPSVEKAYRIKCIQLRRRRQEVETDNDKMRVRVVQLQREILQQRFERAILLQWLEKAVKKKPGEVDEESDDSSENAPTPEERPLRAKRSHRRAPNTSSPILAAQTGLQPLASASSTGLPPITSALETPFSGSTIPGPRTSNPMNGYTAPIDNSAPRQPSLLPAALPFFDANDSATYPEYDREPDSAKDTFIYRVAHEIMPVYRGSFGPGLDTEEARRRRAAQLWDQNDDNVRQAYEDSRAEIARRVKVSLDHSAWRQLSGAARRGAPAVGHSSLGRRPSQPDDEDVVMLGVEDEA